MRRDPLQSMLVMALLLPACGDDGEPPAPPPADLVTAGTYQVVSPFDLTASALLPDPASSYLGALTGLRKDPAGTLFVLLDEAGVPLVGDLQAALPGPIEDQLRGWINGYVFGAAFQNAPVTGELDRLVEQASSVLARFELVTDLELPTTHAADPAEGAHRLRQLRFPIFDGRPSVEVDLMSPLLDPTSPLLVRQTAVSVRVFAGRAGADAALMLGDHAFGIAYGRYAYAALELAARERYGQDLRGALGLLFNCPALAASVSQRCVLGACVGHGGQLTAICEQGLDLAADDLRSRIESLTFDAVRLQRGEAALWDATPADRRVDQIGDGVWSASIDIGMGARTVPATFTGTRLP